MRIPGVRLCWGLLLLAAVWAKAHDPFQSNVDGQLRPDVFELRVIMARSAGSGLLGPEGLEAGHEAVKEIAAQLCTLSTSEGPLTLRDAEAKLTEEGSNLEFYLYYQHPPAGQLELALPYLKKMAEGHCSTVVIVGEKKELLANKDVWPEDGPLRLTIPPPAAPMTNSE